MPILIEHIDAIARHKQRDVLMVCFTPVQKDAGLEDGGSCRSLNWQTLPARQRVIDFLRNRSVAWQRCADFADEGRIDAYAGQIYIDLAYEPENPHCREVLDFFEYPDGTMKDPAISLWLMTLELALGNAHHDEPGFWERWADRF